MDNGGKKLDKLKEKTLPMRPLLSAWGIFGFFFVTLLPLMLIIIKSKELGVWWIPLAIVYMAAFIAVNGILLRRKHLNHMHFLMGDELFYREYPKELERDRRKKEKHRAYLERLEQKRLKEK